MPSPESEPANNPQPQETAAAAAETDKTGAQVEVSEVYVSAIEQEPAKPEWPSEPPQPSFLSRYGKYFIAIALIYLLAGTAARVILKSFERQFEEATSRQALTVEQGPDRRLTVRWNRSLPVVAAADRATLTVIDGGYKEDFVLDSARLKSGSLVYQAKNPLVTFQFQIGALTGYNMSVETLTMKTR